MCRYVVRMSASAAQTERRCISAASLVELVPVFCTQPLEHAQRCAQLASDHLGSELMAVHVNLACFTACQSQQYHAKGHPC